MSTPLFLKKISQNFCFQAVLDWLQRALTICLQKPIISLTKQKFRFISKESFKGKGLTPDMVFLLGFTGKTEYSYTCSYVTKT